MDSYDYKDNYSNKINNICDMIINSIKKCQNKNVELYKKLITFINQ